MRHVALTVVLLASLTGCSTVSPRVSTTLPQIIDGHADFAVHYLRRGWTSDAYDIATALPGQADIPRWRAGGINGVLTTVGSDLPPGSTGHFQRVLASIAWYDALVKEHPDTLIAATSAADFRRAEDGGLIALMPAIEGGDQIDGSLANLRAAFDAGVRSMIIVYDHHNDIGDGAMAMPSSAEIAAPANGGLSSFGREVVSEMNRLGMIVDLSHAADITALQAMRLSSAPVIFSHSAARALADTPRNVSDEVLREVGMQGGVVMVPLVPYLTTTQNWNWWVAGEATFAALETAHSGDEAAIERGMADWDAANPQPTVTVSHVADQIEYIAHVAGIDHVGIGTDFDGMGGFTISGLGDASALPAVLHELERRGWSRADIHKLARGNFLRVLRDVETAAKR
jgi:membrane dipeptidase